MPSTALSQILTVLPFVDHARQTVKISNRALQVLCLFAVLRDPTISTDLALLQTYASCILKHVCGD